MSDFAKRVQEDVERKQREEAQRLEAIASAAQAAAQEAAVKEKRQKQAADDRKAAKEREIRLVRQSAAYLGIVRSKKLLEALEFIWNTVQPTSKTVEVIPPPELTWWEKLWGLKPPAPKRVVHVIKLPFDPSFEEILSEDGLKMILRIRMNLANVGDRDNPGEKIWMICDFHLCWTLEPTDKDFVVRVEKLGIHSRDPVEREDGVGPNFDDSQTDESRESYYHWRSSTGSWRLALIEFGSLEEMIQALSQWAAEVVFTNRFPRLPHTLLLSQDLGRGISYY